MEVKDIKLHTVYTNSHGERCIVYKDNGNSIDQFIYGGAYITGTSKFDKFVPKWTLTDITLKQFVDEFPVKKFYGDKTRNYLEQLKKLVYPDTVNTGFELAVKIHNCYPMSLVTVDKDRFSSSMKSDTDTDRRRLLLII